MQVTMAVEVAGKARTVFDPEDWMVTAPELLLTIWKPWPSTIVEATGKVTV